MSFYITDELLTEANEVLRTVIKVKEVKCARCDYGIGEHSSCWRPKFWRQHKDWSSHESSPIRY